MISFRKGIVVATIIAAFFGVGGAAGADIKWVTLQVKGGESVQAALGIVEGSKRPAVVFNHGTGVRQYGHQGAVSKGNMDVTDYVKALNAMDYSAIAPVRVHMKGEARYEGGGTVGSNDAWMAVVRNGMNVSTAARAFLAKDPNVDPDRIAIMGFSEGGNISLWSATRIGGYKAVVLLAPATLRNAKKFSLMSAVKPKFLSAIEAPMFVAVGKRDIKPIIKVTSGRLVPTMKDLGKVIVYRNDYPGGHDWFYKPRKPLLDDLEAFLAEHL